MSCVISRCRCKSPTRPALRFFGKMICTLLSVVYIQQSRCHGTIASDWLISFLGQRAPIRREEVPGACHGSINIIQCRSATRAGLMYGGEQVVGSVVAARNGRIFNELRTPKSLKLFYFLETYSEKHTLHGREQPKDRTGSYLNDARWSFAVIFEVVTRVYKTGIESCGCGDILHIVLRLRCGGGGGGGGGGGKKQIQKQIIEKVQVKDEDNEVVIKQRKRKTVMDLLEIIDKVTNSYKIYVSIA